TFYSLQVNTLNDPTFSDRERTIVRRTMGRPSYQRYRTALFFRHIIAYSLLQACAVVMDEKNVRLNTGIRLILGGNAWGLMLFAEFKRNVDELKEEAESILQVLKKRIIEMIPEGEEHKEDRKRIQDLKISDIILLNEAELAKSKTTVALGALKAREPNREKTKAYAGITLKGFRVNDLPAVTVHWHERWGHDSLKGKLNFRGDINRLSFDQPDQFENPLDPILDIFTILGNNSHPDEDPLPGHMWAKINGELCRSRAYVENTMIGASPINYFISKILYPEDDDHTFLNELAKANDSYTR
ncbi:MAG TPA: hypothetical protein VJX74_14535, partial [Blastocatellia bacterium]|nr:hypothetical protein [Blastocatellia bacterium]